MEPKKKRARVHKWTVDTSHPLGTGSFGNVYASTSSAGAQPCVAKCFQKIKPNEKDGRDVLLREYLGAFVLQHPHIVRGRGVGFFRENPCLLLENAGVDLGTFLEEAVEGEHHVATADHVMLQILDALKYLASLGLVHGDLKPPNICLRRQGMHVKLVDLGALEASDVGSVLTTTRWYRTIEQELELVHRSTVDLWSAGCIYAELLVGLQGQGAERHSRVLCPGHCSEYSPLPQKARGGCSQLRAILRGVVRVQAELYLKQHPRTGEGLAKELAIETVRGQIHTMMTLSISPTSSAQDLKKMRQFLEGLLDVEMFDEPLRPIRGSVEQLQHLATMLDLAPERRRLIYVQKWTVQSMVSAPAIFGEVADDAVEHHPIEGVEVDHLREILATLNHERDQKYVEHVHRVHGEQIEQIAMRDRQTDAQHV